MSTGTGIQIRYSDIIATLVCALILWVGAQMYGLSTSNARIETDVMNIRSTLDFNIQQRLDKERDVDSRLRALEIANGEEKGLREGVRTVPR